MALQTGLGPQHFLMGGQSSLYQGCQADSIKVDGARDLVETFDVFLFSADCTLCNNGMVLPTAATLVPYLRKKGKRVGVFSLDERVSREDITHQLNRAGLSFTQQRIMDRRDFGKVQDLFPLASRQRILMVCGDILSEVSIGQSHQIATLLVLKEGYKSFESYGIEPDFFSTSV